MRPASRPYSTTSWPSSSRTNCCASWVMSFMFYPLVIRSRATARLAGTGGRDSTSQSAEPIVNRRSEGRRGYQYHNGNCRDQKAVLDDILTVFLTPELA